MVFRVPPALVFASSLLAVATQARAQTAGKVLDGKQIFMAQKCDACHTVSSADIKPTGKIKAPDLTGLATQREANWLVKFLRKEVDNKGKKHLKPFTGSDEELGALVAWLQDQKKK